MDDKVKELVDKIYDKTYADYDKIFKANRKDTGYLVDEIEKLAAKAERENFTKCSYNIPFYDKSVGGLYSYIEFLVYHFGIDKVYRDYSDELGKRIFGSEYYNLMLIGLGFKFGDLMTNKFQELETDDDYKYCFEATARAVTSDGGIVVDLWKKGIEPNKFSCGNLWIQGIKLDDLVTMPMENLVSGNFQVRYRVEGPRGKQPDAGTVAFKDLAQKLKEIRDTFLKRRY